MALQLDIRLAKGETAPTTQELLARTLETLVGVGGRFTVGELRRAARVTHLGASNSFIRYLLAEKIIAGTPRSGRYQLMRPVPPMTRAAEPQTNHEQQQAWNVLRGPAGRQGISRADLCIMASTSSVQVDAAIEGYLDVLVAAGVLREDAKGLRLVPVYNTGPLAPRIYRAFVPVDSNLRTVCTQRLAADEVTP